MDGLLLIIAVLIGIFKVLQMIKRFISVEPDSYNTGPINTDWEDEYEEDEMPLPPPTPITYTIFGDGTVPSFYKNEKVQAPSLPKEGVRTTVAKVEKKKKRPVAVRPAQKLDLRLKNKKDIQRAFIYSEIFQRKYS